MRLALYAILAGGCLVVGSGCQMLGSNECTSCNSCNTCQSCDTCGNGCGSNSWGFHNPCPTCDSCDTCGPRRSGLLGRFFGRAGGAGGALAGAGAGAAGLGNGGGMGYYPEANYAGPPTGTVTYPYYTTRGPRDFLARQPLDIGP